MSGLEHQSDCARVGEEAWPLARCYDDEVNTGERRGENPIRFELVCVSMGR